MKISDAKPGDVLRDKDGVEWLRRRDGIRVRNYKWSGAIWSPHEFEEVEKEWGPFARLTTEREPTDAA